MPLSIASPTINQPITGAAADIAAMTMTSPSSRHRGIRGISRGVARNPVDHPNGGGQGKAKSGGGWQHLTNPWGLLAKGFRTRVKNKDSNRFIVVRRDGRPMKQK